jgi:hypothetical protein
MCGGAGGIKGSHRGVEVKYDIIVHYNNLVNSTMYLFPAQQ